MQQVFSSKICWDALFPSRLPEIILQNRPRSCSLCFAAVGEDRPSDKIGKVFQKDFFLSPKICGSVSYSVT